MDRIAVAIALGSNLPPREEHLAHARRRLAALLTGARFSTVYETEPSGVTVAQGAFLNQAGVGETSLPARDLLEQLLEIEREAGRTRPFRFAPRTLDLDLILYGDLVLEDPGLTVPHPRFRERGFVLDPLCEIVPEMRDPVTGQTVEQLRARLSQLG